MKPSRSYFIWILLLAIGLMTLILTAQVYTSRNVKGLINGNREAAITFTINNSLQEIVNISFSVESAITRKMYRRSGNRSIKDSLTMLGYNAAVLEKLNLDTVIRNEFKSLNALVGEEIALGSGAIEAFESGNPALQSRLTDSMARLKLGDSIYNKAVTIGRKLESKLQATLNQNAVASGKLSDLNKAIALIAVAAILIMGTIIINRHLKQAGLIRDLGRANNEVQKSSLIKDQFLANMSHEFRTPLNAIKGFSGLMQQTPLNPEQQQYADIIKSSSLHLLSLVDDILDISKIEAGKMNIEHREFNLANLMQMLENLFGNAAGEVGLQYHWQIAESVPKTLVGDPDRLGQILINLVSNAIKFTRQGGIRVLVSRAEKPGEELWLRFRVEDTGMGISPENLEIIFERFQQAGNHQQAIQKGTGLGLSIVKNLSRLLGGDVTVESTLNKGSVFTVDLPFKGGTGKQDFVSEEEIIPDLSEQYPLAKVLVAEDNKVNQLLITHLLRRNGIVPEIRENGQEVLEALDHRSFDLLLLDLQMPVMDGYTAAAKIREKQIPIPIVAMTAYVMSGEKEKCLTAGMDDYIAKPIDEKILQEVLKRFLPHERKVIAANDENREYESYLLRLSGGDQEMANRIREEVKKELPGEIANLEKIINEKNTEGLQSTCHHLVSTLSPLGNDTPAMRKLLGIQGKMNTEEENVGLLQLGIDLKTEMEKLYESIGGKDK
jgi:signal transduction histidine kinase/CheY-like chemotaxis protein